MTVDLPRWLLADRLAAVLGAAAGLALEVVLAAHPGAPFGLGVVAAAALVAWQWRRQSRRPLALELALPAGSLRLGDGRRVPLVLGHGCRVLGPTLVLHWRSPGRSQAVWLTPFDLPRGVLRSLAVGLVTGGRPVRP